MDSLKWQVQLRKNRYDGMTEVWFRDFVNLEATTFAICVNVLKGTDNRSVLGSHSY